MRIERATQLRAYTRDEFEMVTLSRNYAFRLHVECRSMVLTAVALGFLVGVAISGQTFYNFTARSMNLELAVGVSQSKLMGCEQR